MKKQIRAEKKKQLDKKIQEFLGMERWQPTNIFVKRDESKTGFTQDRNLLIRKYKSKFPDPSPSVVEEQNIIQL